MRRCSLGSSDVFTAGIPLASTRSRTSPSMKSTRASGQGKPQTSADQDGSRKSTEQFRPRRLHEPCSSEPRRDRPRAIRHASKRHRHHAHRGQLRPRRQARVKELRQESGEEDDRLRIRKRDQEGAHEPRPSRLHKPLAALPRMPPSLHAEPDEIGRAGPAQGFEHEVGMRAHPVEPEGNSPEQQGIAERRAGDGRGAQPVYLGLPRSK